MDNARISAREFEAHVAKVLRRRYKEKDGWEVLPKKLLVHKGMKCKCDFLLQNAKTGIKMVVDAKAKEKLTNNDIDQLMRYKKQAKADLAIFYIRPDTDYNIQAIEGHKIQIKKTEPKSRGIIFQIRQQRPIDLTKL